MAALATPVRKILVIVAMEQEVQPLVEHFALKPEPSTAFLAGAPFVAWTGKGHGVAIHAVWCGRDTRFGNVNAVGTTAAGVATYAAIAAFGAPDLVISAGTAGGFKSTGAAVGDVGGPRAGTATTRTPSCRCGHICKSWTIWLVVTCLLTRRSQAP